MFNWTGARFYSNFLKLSVFTRGRAARQTAISVVASLSSWAGGVLVYTKYCDSSSRSFDWTPQSDTNLFCNHPHSTSFRNTCLKNIQCLTFIFLICITVFALMLETKVLVHCMIERFGRATNGEIWRRDWSLERSMVSDERF